MVQTTREIIEKNLHKLRDEINAYHDEKKLWYREGSIANPAGNLCLHLVGNLKTYIGVALGGSDYIRNRELEFSLSGLPKSELIAQVEGTIKVVNSTLRNLPDEKLALPFPMKVFEAETTTGYMLVHLAAHLTYHLGQINYHRRLLDEPQ
jgi:uncharacterized damage-inducible protein DinB